MPRYEFVEGTSSKFWEIEFLDDDEGNGFTTTYGRIGAAGQSTTKKFGSPDAAVDGYSKLVGEKLKKGYKLVAKAKPAKGAAKPAKGAARPAVKMPVVMLSMGLEDAAEAVGGAKGKALARTAAALETYLGRIAGPPEKKEHFGRLAKLASPALSSALADVLDRYEPSDGDLRSYGPGDELIAYLFLLAQGGHPKTRELWERWVAASPPQFACHLGIAALQVTKRPFDALLQMAGEQLARKSSSSPAVQIAKVCDLSYPPIGFWTLSMTVGSSFDVERDTITLDVNYPDGEDGWRVEMCKGTKDLSYPPLEKGRKVEGGFGPFAPPRADALPAFFEAVARKAKIRLAWETLEVRSNLKKVDKVKTLFAT